MSVTDNGWTREKKEVQKRIEVETMFEYIRVFGVSFPTTNS